MDTYYKSDKRSEPLDGVELLYKILEYFVNSNANLSIDDIQKHTKIPKNKITDILSVLEKRGYLKKYKQRNKYHITYKILMLL